MTALLAPQMSLIRQNGELNNNINLVNLAATTATALFVNASCKGCMIFILLNTVTGTSPTLVVNLQLYDPVTGVYVTVASSASLTAAGTYSLMVYPGITPSATQVSAILGPSWRLNLVVGGTTPSFSGFINVSTIV